MLRVKMSGKMEGLFTVQDVAKDHDLPGKVLKFDVTNLEKYFDKESWYVIMKESTYVSPLFNRKIQKLVKCLKAQSYMFDLALSTALYYKDILVILIFNFCNILKIEQLYVEQFLVSKPLNQSCSI